MNCHRLELTAQGCICGRNQSCRSTYTANCPPPYTIHPCSPNRNVSTTPSGLPRLAGYQDSGHLCPLSRQPPEPLPSGYTLLLVLIMHAVSAKR
ncbi:hypothetical protein AAHC03_013966 [Spirometra sp. Aus1]